MGQPIERKRPLRLTREGYKKVCKLVDDRDCGCVVCRDPHVQHHHIIYRSEGGEDRLENLVALCPFHHMQLGHGWNKHEQQQEFLKYTRDECKEFNKQHQKELETIYKLEKRR